MTSDKRTRPIARARTDARGYARRTKQGRCVVHPASRRQINLMLDTFGQTPEVTAFDLGCLNHTTARMSFRKAWTAPQVRKAFGWLAARNTTGSSCFVRPARAIDKTSWVLVDSLRAATLKRLSAAHPPHMVVQTAVESFQAWLRIKEPLDVATRIDVARAITREIGGDPDTVDVTQFGHLPGMTNRMPSEAREGRPAFVVLRSTSSAAVTPIPVGASRTDGRDHAWGREDDSWKRWTERDTERADDRSDRDFAIACRLLEAGADDHTIVATIAAVRGFDPRCRGDYIARTVRAARRHIQTRS